MGKVESIEQKKIRQKELARKYIMSDEVDQTTLEELNHLCKPIYLYIYGGYHIRLPHMDRDDYLLIGYITLWRVLEKCRENPDIINSFSAYLFSSVRNAYATEFRKYVMKNPLVRVRYEEPGGGYNISNAFSLADYYLEKDREKAKRYYHNHIEEIRVRKKEYRKKHRAELTEKNREYRKANSDKINARRREYYKEHRDEKRARASRTSLPALGGGQGCCRHLFWRCRHIWHGTPHLRDA
jgi:hypothetical protein